MVTVQAKMQPQNSGVPLVNAINAVGESIETHWPQAKWCFFDLDVEGKD